MTQENQTHNEEKLDDENIVTENISEEAVSQEDESSSQTSSSDDDQIVIIQRLKADYDNLVKRHAREREEMKTFFTANIVGKILPAYDNIARIADQSNESTSAETLLAGIKSAKDIFEKGLTSVGVNKFDSVGQDVDPARHDVMSQGPGPQGKIIADFESGFMMGEHVVRHAKVVVGIGE